MKHILFLRIAGACVLASMLALTHYRSPVLARQELTPQAFIVVNTSADDDEANATCSLREAIIASNTNAAYKGCNAGAAPPSTDFIAIDGDVDTIVVGPSALPAITDGSIVIFTTDNPGTSLPDRTALNGSGLSVGDDMLTIASSRVTVRGFLIINIPESGTGIKVTAGTGINIVDNNIGIGERLLACQTNLSTVGILIEDGVNDLGSNDPSVRIRDTLIGCMGRYGVLIDGADDVQLGDDVASTPPNLIGTTSSGFALPNASGVGIGRGSQNNTILNNVIAGNTSHGILMRGKGDTASPDTRNNTIAGNLIGMLRSGNVRPNGKDGIVLLEGATLNTIGGFSVADRNIISANAMNGVNLIHSDANSVLGNYIGTNISGTAVLSGQVSGISIQAGSANIIGCSQACPGATRGNVIGGNDVGVRIIGGVDHKLVSNQIGFQLVFTAANIPLPNGTAGIDVSGATTRLLIGDPSVANRGNFVGYNNNGIELHGSGVKDSVLVNNVVIRNSGIGLVIGANASGTRVGDATASNLISENTYGILIRDGASGSRVENATVRNNAGYGVLFSGGAQGNVISNTEVHNNGYMGIGRFADSPKNDWSQLSVYDNGELGIDIEITPTLEISSHVDAPELSITTTSKPDAANVSVSGSAPPTPNGPALTSAQVELYRLDLDPGGDGEGKVFLGSATTNERGLWKVTYADEKPVGCYIALLRTRIGATWSASEFSASNCMRWLPIMARGGA